MLSIVSKEGSYPWRMRVVLAHLRDLGMDFDAAWSRALMALPRPTDQLGQVEREEWGRILQDQRAVWEATYESWPTPALDHELAEERLADLQLPAA